MTAMRTCRPKHLSSRSSQNCYLFERSECNDSKRLTTFKRRIRKNSKFTEARIKLTRVAVITPRPVKQLGSRKEPFPPRQIRALSLARFELARSLCTVLHLPASLTSHTALTCHSHRPAPSMCPSGSAAPPRTPMLSFLSVSAHVH